MALADPRPQSVQVLPDAKKDGQVLDLEMFSFQRGPILQAWGTRGREEQLRNIYRHDYNWMAQGAFAGIMKMIASTPWEIKGPEDITGAQDKMYRHAYRAAGFGGEPDGTRSDIEYWQAFVRKADFGRGWGSFVQKGVDYLRQDAGWFWEIIGPGNAMGPLTGPATGLAHLDSLRCIPTGDPEFPVIYVDRRGKLHTMHHTRIVQLVDMPDGDERRPGYGLCALSRAISIVYREVLMGRFIEASVDDKPKPGMAIAKGFNRDKRNEALSWYMQEQSTDDRAPWGKTLWFYGMDRDSAPEIELMAFAEAPEKFDFKTYTELDVDALALAIGVDRQDLWQLTGGNLGSGTQSEILHQKSRGKTIGFLRTNIERCLNDILPEDYEFAFKFRDAQEDQERASTAQVWAGAVSTAGQHLDDDEARRILADTVEQFGDALRDDNGEIRTRDDVDVKPAGEDEDVTRDDNEDAGPATNGAPAARQPDDERNVGRREFSADATTKDIQATRLNFEADWSDLITAVKSGDVARSRFRIVARALLRRHGLQAYRDGLEAGGVSDDLDDDDEAQFALWLAERNSFVGGLADRLYTDEVNVNADSSAAMWANNSLQAAYYDGLSSANRNGMYEFGGEDGAESCATCKRLKGQRHRMKDWTRRRLRPGVDVQNFECKAFNCNHILIPTDQPARGRF